MTCPTCSGQKLLIVHLHTTTGGRWEKRACFTCCGAGEITEDHARQIEEGERRREDRKARYTTLREEAARLGISARQLSDIENGRAAQGDGGTGN